MTPEPGTFQVDEAIHIEFSKMTCRANAVRPIGIMSAVVLIAAAILFLVGTNDSIGLGIGVLIGLAVGLGLIFLSYMFLLPRQAVSLFRQSGYLREPQTISFEESGFLMEQASGHGRHQWTMMNKWNETDALFAIYLNRMLAFVLPKDQIAPATIDFIRSQLIASGLPKKGKQRR